MRYFILVLEVGIERETGYRDLESAQAARRSLEADGRIVDGPYCRTASGGRVYPGLKAVR